jgi:hypothetical protein
MIDTIEAEDAVPGLGLDRDLEADLRQIRDQQERDLLLESGVGHVGVDQRSIGCRSK